MLLLAIAVLESSGCSTPKHGVIPPNYDYGGVCVGGEVKLPGETMVWGCMTVFKSIASAGGFTASANRKKVQLTRRDGELHIINCANIARGDNDLPVYPGDSIYVPRTSKWVFG